MNRHFGLVAALGLVTASVGTGCAPCAPGAYGHAHFGGYGHPSGVAAVAGLVVAGAVLATDAAIASQDPPQDDEEPEVIVVQAPAPLPPQRMQPPAAPRPSPVAFDAGAAADSLHALDLSTCVDAGALPRTYGHAQVTFDPSGKVSKVAIDRPANLSAAAVSCLGDRLGQATAPRFDGNPATVGTGFVVP